MDPALITDSRGETSVTEFAEPVSSSHPSTSNTEVIGVKALKASWNTNKSAWPLVRGYELLSVIGTGGMGIVYKARHRDLRRIVAIKTIRNPVLGDDDFLVRFHAEAEAVAQLQHPNIIQIFEIGTLEPRGGEQLPIPFIALECVDGGSLSDRANTPQSPQFAAQIVEKLARAAHAAHRLGVIHRDLKPANVLLTSDGEPKIADFGIAKQLHPERDSAGRCVTQAGMVMGTPEYMAPEHAMGEPPTPAIDVYALGVILYQLLTGRVPFEAASPYETMELARNQEPNPPRRLRPELPRDIDTICLKCLEKTPGRRYASAEALANDLQRFLDRRTIQARRIGPIEKAGRWCKRNPVVAGALASVMVVFLTAFALVSESYFAAEHARQEESSQRQAAQEREKAERWERYRANIASAANAFEVHSVGGARRALEATPEEHRNWEWQHFQSRLDLAQHVLMAISPDQISNYDISADGRRVVLASNRAIHVWDTVDRRQLVAIDSPSDLTHVHLSPDGGTLSYRKTDREVVLYDVAANRVRAVLGGHEKTVQMVAFAADNKRVVSGSHDQNLRVWDVETGNLVRIIETGWLPQANLSFSADALRMTLTAPDDPSIWVWDVEAGLRVATLAVDPEQVIQATHLNDPGDRVFTTATYPSSTLQCWDATTGKRLSVMKGHRNSVTTYAVSPDGLRVATSSRDQTVGLWELATGRPIAMLRGHSGSVSHVTFSADGKRLISSAEDHTVRLWSGVTGEALAVLHGHTGDVFQAAYMPDQRTIASISRDGTIRLWDAQAAETDGILGAHSTFVYGVAFHPDGERVASAGWDGAVRIWNATTNKPIAQFDHGQRTIVSSVAFHPKGKILASRARGSVRLWDVDSGHELHCWNTPSDAWRDTRLAYDPRGDRLATGVAGGLVRVWDVASHAELATFKAHTDEVRDVAFSPSGRWLASVGDTVVRIWDTNDWKEVQALRGHAAGAYAVTFNADGTLLASAGVDGTVRIWSTATWNEVNVLKHGVNVYGLSFSPDGTRLASSGADTSIHLWDVKSGQEVATLRGHTDYIHQIAFSPDGTRLASASGDWSVRIWDTLSPVERRKK